LEGQRLPVAGSARFLAVVGGCALPIEKIHQEAVMPGRDVDEASTACLPAAWISVTAQWIRLSASS